MESWYDLVKPATEPCPWVLIESWVTVGGPSPAANVVSTKSETGLAAQVTRSVPIPAITIRLPVWPRFNERCASVTTIKDEYPPTEPRTCPTKDA
jgi:hypothetical protein